MNTPVQETMNYIHAALHLCTDLQRSGCVVAWLVANADKVSRAWPSARFLDKLATSDAWQRAGRRRLALPIRLGDFKEVQDVLRNSALEDVVAGEFISKWNKLAWTYISCMACNMMYGQAAAFEAGGWSKAEQTIANAVGSGVDRILSHGQEHFSVSPGLEKELKSRRINYQGEEIGVCHQLTLKQIQPSLPPPEHGASIEVLDFVSQHTKDLLINPHLSILPDEGQDLPKLQGKIHIQEDQRLIVAQELIRRKICEWVPLDSVAEYRGQKILNGLFGVPKSAQLPDGSPILRVIMNLVPTNSILRQFKGAVKNLPSITSWMSICMDENHELRIWQSDMSNAFYLFKIPDPWIYFLAFNLIFPGKMVGSKYDEPVALACRVLPMGWLSSVAVMQEISERILLTKQLDPLSQIVKNRPIPQWLVGILDEARVGSRPWWHIYLDNFAAGQLIAPHDQVVHGNLLHELAEKAWQESGVVSSAKKRKAAEISCNELGAFIDGDNQFIGGSSERLVKLIQATMFLLSQPILSKKLVQVVAGRWIHVMQFRRPTMSFFEHTWSFVGSKRMQQGIHLKVRGEFMACVMATCFMHTHLGASISERMTASDASSTGGAVGVASTLSQEGNSYVEASLNNLRQLPDIPVLVISLFGGIGGSFRVYDLLGLRPLGLIHFDTHGPANRVVSKRWPHAEIFLDVRTFTRETIRDLLSRYLGIEEIHLWGGFPCVDLSSANASGKGLAGDQSGLFYELVRIKDIIASEVGNRIQLKTTVENVASMPQSERNRISTILGTKPYFLDCSDSVPMRRPRLCWTSERLNNIMDDVWVVDEGEWWRVYAEAPYPQMEQWIEEGYSWPGGRDGAILPTAMKAIKRARPPYKPAGIDRCSWNTLDRYAADEFRFPPYQYSDEFIFYSPHGLWRTVSVEEKELLLGYGWNHTAVCMNASTIKSSKQRYKDERHSLLGDSFSMYSFIIPGVALCQRFLPRIKYRMVANRMGLAPGFRCSIRRSIPLQRNPAYGFEQVPPTRKVSELNRLLFTRTNHTGSDIRIASGEILNPKSIPRQGVEAAWWKWNSSFKTRWIHKEHINILELRSILLALRYHILHFGASNQRIFHITDSFVCMSVVGKGRTSSKNLSKVLKQLNAFLLAFNLYLILGHVESTTNPTDEDSRSVAI